MVYLQFITCGFFNIMVNLLIHTGYVNK